MAWVGYLVFLVEIIFENKTEVGHNNVQVYQLEMAPLLNKHYVYEGFLSGEKIP